MRKNQTKNVLLLIVEEMFSLPEAINVGNTLSSIGPPINNTEVPRMDAILVPSKVLKVDSVVAFEFLACFDSSINHLDTIVFFATESCIGGSNVEEGRQDLTAGSCM